MALHPVRLRRLGVVVDRLPERFRNFELVVGGSGRLKPGPLFAAGQQPRVVGHRRRLAAVLRVGVKPASPQPLWMQNLGG